ncbi:cyanophycinase [Alkalicella caledoniensis]|uniref:Cyanophycinase n=1 Tax=Alkalicella caledoniensis TaxID=2731377 RepID=A0A7G9W872_ALKCA|nr:cyanophycinase [Alkalicella caledoniensis]QNO14884.1 cyanophycinase [Alkalicella caledoniensis]
MEKVDGNLLIIGGAEDKTGDCLILKEFVNLAKGRDGKIVIMPTATEQPDKVGEQYSEIFKDIGVSEVEVLKIDCRKDALSQKAQKSIEDATGIFFTGGDQLRITSLLGGTPVDHSLQKVYKEGVVIAGTSAGAAAMSSTMIIGGNGESTPQMGILNMAPGMGLLNEAVVDQHFAQRGRLGRLLAAVAQNPYILGIGIDEDTSVLINREAKLKVIGSQTVTIVDGRDSGFTNVSELKPEQPLAITDVLVHILPHGYCYDLKERKPLLN